MISTASSESSSRTASAICSFGIDFEDLAADRVVDLGQRHPVEVVAHEADELVALLRIERLQHVAEVGLVQVADETAERRRRHARLIASETRSTKSGSSAPSSSRMPTASDSFLVAVSASTVFLRFSRAE